jgi:long-chain acyl-CoA synthetase
VQDHRGKRGQTALRDHGADLSKTGFRAFERIFRFTILHEAFQVNDELSAKQEIKRHVIAAKYSREIREMFT